MARISLKQFAQFSEGELRGISEVYIERIAFDSRKLLVPAETIFIAIRGNNHDGHKYVRDLYRRGVKVFMVEQEFDFEGLDNAAFIVVDNTITALHKVAVKVRQRFNFPVVGITGSNGKTIVKEWAGRILEKKIRVGRSPRSYNSQLGVPLSILMLGDDCDVALIEAGISQPGEMKSLQRVVDPEIGIITNIGQAHQENFASIKDKLEEKIKLFQSSSVVLYNRDQQLVHSVLNTTYPEIRKLTYGLSEEADLKIKKPGADHMGSNLALTWKGEDLELHIPFSDEASIENILVSVLLALHLGLEFTQIRDAVKELQPVAMRLEQKEGVNNCILIDDAYNSDLTSLELALDFLDQLGSRKGLSKTLILSDIYQSGMSSEEWFAEIGKLIKTKGIDRFIGIGPDLYKATDGKDAFKSTEAFLNQIHINSFRDEAILLKGSRAFSFEYISAFLEQKRHKTVLEVNLNALMNNAQVFRGLLEPKVKMLAMVKAFSYGSGSFEIANLLQHQKVDYLGVAFADEGIELREAGINLPIIVMNPEVSSFPLMLQYDLEPEIYSFNILHDYITATERQGAQNVPVHIKVDTGMNRLGFLPGEMDRLVEELNSCRLLKVASVFSHLAGSDEAVHDEFTREQGAVFIKCCLQLKEGLGYSFVRHILNSAGIERFPELQLDMVRLGIGMYGISAAGKHLQVVGRLKSYVSQLKTVKPGHTIGYSRKGEAEEETVIAVIPVGYADGLNRRLSNGVGRVVINNQNAPIVGNICMDMCMVDVTRLQVNEGDEVEMFGENYTIEQMAQALGTIPYEVLTSVSRRVKRVYYME